MAKNSQKTRRSRASAVKHSPLYKELEQIGRNEKTIQPAALVTYEYLLTCEQVRMRLERNPNDAPANLAHEALLEGIDHIVNADLRLTAEAALAATPEFEGQSVTKRKDLLDENHGIKGYTYDNLRLEALEFIHNWLATPPRPAPRWKHRRALRELWPAAEHYSEGSRKVGLYYAESAMRFYHAGLASLFADQFDSEHASQHNAPGSERDLVAWDACATNAFEEFIPVRCNLDRGQLTDDFRFFRAFMPMEEAETAALLSESAIALGPPFGPNDRLYLRWHMGQEYVSERATHAERLRLIYQDVWLPWYRNSLVRDVSLLPSEVPDSLAADQGSELYSKKGTSVAEYYAPPSLLQILVAKFGALWHKLDHFNPLSGEVAEQSLRQAIDTVRFYYSSFEPEWIALHIAQPSLNEEVREYIKVVGQELVKSALVWHNIHRNH
jgi:hypothetical protein